MTKQTAPKPEPKTRTLSQGVLVGRIADRLLKLEAEEREALAASPATIKAAFDKKRQSLLLDLSDAQRSGVLAMVEAMRPVDDDDGPVSE